MLRQSLKLFLKSLPTSSIIQNALQKTEENDFHKRLRNELFMLPIPKVKFLDRRVPSGLSHVLQSAISRVSLSHIEKLQGH